MGLLEGSKPRNRGLLGRPLRFGGWEYWQAKRYVGPAGWKTPVLTFREEKAPKGESQERRRCERKPARAQREQAVKRVTKPCRRNVAGGHARGKWTSEP